MMRSSNPPKSLSIAILGATGYVGRTMVTLLAENPHFEITALIGSAASVGRQFGDVWQEKEDRLCSHYGAIWQKKQIPAAVADHLVDGLDIPSLENVDLVFSSVPEIAISDEQKIIDAGIRVISNNPIGRLVHPLIIPELFTEKPKNLMLKLPNCVSTGLALALAPLKSLGIAELQATTFQSLSGRGDRLYPKEWAVGNIFPIGSDVEETQDYIADELKLLLDLSFLPQVRSYRVYVQEGHLVDVTVGFDKPISLQEIESIWENWNPLHAEKRPLILSKEAGHPQSKDTRADDGMAVYIGNTQQRGAQTIAFTLGVHNIIRGAAGNAILTAEWLLNLTA